MNETIRAGAREQGEVCAQPEPSRRELFEEQLLARFPTLKPLEVADLNTIAAFKDGSFAVSLLGFMLYANGYNLRGRSRFCRGGLLYHDGRNLFSVGMFRKTVASPVWHLMINAPRGASWFAAVDGFVKAVQALGNEAFGETYVRHLTPAQFEVMRAAGYRSIDCSPWDPEAPSEDETRNHKLILLEDIIACGESGELTIHKLAGEGSRSFRAKAKLSFNRFENFLQRNGLRLEMRDYGPADQASAEELVRRHFASLKHPVGSTPEDYLGLVLFDPALAGEQCLARMGFLCGPNARIPAMLYIGEKTAPDTLALYATFACRDQDLLPQGVTPQGFSAISQYGYLMLFDWLYRNGIRRVNLGGSETEDLDKFKRQLGARHDMSYWVVAPGVHP